MLPNEWACSSEHEILLPASQSNASQRMPRETAATKKQHGWVLTSLTCIGEHQCMDKCLHLKIFPLAVLEKTAAKLHAVTPPHSCLTQLAPVETKVLNTAPQTFRENLKKCKQ